MKIIAIAAIDAKTNGIGKDNQLCWHLPKDMAFFKKTTGKNPVIMGRKTYDSLPVRFRPLPNRLNYVLTNDKVSFEQRDDVKGVIPLSLNEAKILLRYAEQTEAEEDDLYIIGGAEIYHELFPYCHQLILTEVNTTVTDGMEFDTFLKIPEYFEYEKTLEEHDDCEMNLYINHEVERA